MTSKESSKLDLKLSVIMMQSYPARTLDRRLQKDWARDAREDPRVLKSLRTHLLLEVASPLSLPSPFRCHSSSKEQRNPLMKKNLGLQALMELTSCGIRASSSSVNGEGSTPKDPLYKILDELRSLKLWKEKQERKEKRKKKKERKILKELRKEKHASSSSHNSCKSLSEELRDYYEGRHRSHLRPHSHGREMERKPQEANINLPYFNGKDNVEADLDWEIREVYFKILWLSLLSKENQGQGILGVTPSKPKDDKGKTIEKQPLKASMQEKTRFMKCFKCLGRGHITYQCPTKKNMIMRGQDIYSSQDEVTTSTSSSESEEAKGEESSEEIYPQGEGQPLMVKEECKEVSVSSKRLAKKESHFEVKTNIKETYPLRQPPHFLLCKKTLVSIATPLRLEFIPQVKELLDEGLVRKSLNPCALCCGKKPRVSRTSGFEGEGMMQSYPARALDRRIQKDWARDAREGPRVLMSLRGTGHKDPLSRILDELSSLKLWKEKLKRKEKGKERVKINQDEREQIREEERRKILKELRKEKHASYSSHNSCKSLSEERRDYYEGRHRSHLRPHSHRREKERKPQEANINFPYFHGKDNVEANLDWEIRVEQQLKRKSTSKSYGSHSYPKKDQGQGILGVTPSKPKDDKGETIKKQPLKASMQEKTSSMKCFKCFGRGHITSQCPTKKTMIMRGQDIYSSQDEATTSPSSSESEEAKGEESSEEIYPQEEGKPLMVKEECKEVSVSSKRLAKKERHFEIKTNIKEISPLRQPLHFLLCKKTLVSIASPLRLEFIPQVKKLLDEGLVRKSLNPCALLVPKIGVPMNPKRIKVIPEGPTPPSIREIWGFHDLTNFYKSVEEKSPEFQEPRDLRSNPFQGGGNDAILPHKGIGYKTPRRLGQRCKELHFKVQTSFEAQNFVLLLSFSLYASSPTFKLLSMASYGGELLLDSSSP
ncbi:hypothetical protein HKD37_18G050662 [Glycine soja]